MDAALLQARGAQIHANFLQARAARQTCHYDSKTHRQICKKESFFHRVGRWILTAVLIFVVVTALMVLCCCLQCRKKRAKNVDASGGGGGKKGIFGMFGKKKNQDQTYNLETAGANGAYAPGHSENVYGKPQ